MKTYIKMYSNFKTKDRMRNVLGILAGAIITLVLFQNCQKSDFLIITGVVKDSLTNLPIEGAYINTGDEKYISTSSDGTFSIEGIQPGKIKFQVIFNRGGYKSISKSVIITSGRVNKVNFVLSPIPKPEIETGRVTNITSRDATITGNLKLKSGVSVSKYGHCWSYTTTFPTLEDNVGFTENFGASGDVSFISTLTGLQSDIIYYVRAYSITNAGVIYGNSVGFKTSEFEINYGLIYYFPFDGNYIDISGLGYILYPDFGIYPAFTNDRFGVPNRACHFSNNIDLWGSGTPALNDFTVSLWFYKSNSWENSQQHMFQIGDSYNHDNIFYIRQDASPNNFNCGIRLNNSDYRLTLSSSPSLNVWHHVLTQRKGSELYLYIDGILKSSMNCPSDILPSSRYFNIGAGWIGSAGPQYQQFYGDIDDVRVYNRALNTSEIQYLKTH